MDETSWKRIQKGQKFIAELTTLGGRETVNSPLMGSSRICGERSR